MRKITVKVEASGICWLLLFTGFDKLAEYKPLAKVEELEELNYNMIDDRLNNGAEKAQMEAIKKEQKQLTGKTSLKARLAEKKAQIAGSDKLADTQENIKKNQREM